MQEYYDLLAGLSLERVAQHADVPVRSAKREFRSGELREALMQDLLRVRPSEDIADDDFVEFTGRLTDRGRPLADELGDIVSSIVHHNTESELFRALMGFWAFAEHDPDARQRISTMYQQWVRGARDGLNAMFMQHLEVMPLRKDWITVEDFVRTMIAVVEGLAIQLSVADPTPLVEDNGSSDLRAGVPAMDPELPRKIVLAMMMSMVDIEGLPSAEEVFAQIEGHR